MKTKKLEFRKGNKKLPKSTYILNMGSATDCPNRCNGRCQAGNLCYALKAEVQYPDVLPFRRRQALQWQSMTALEIATALLDASKRSRQHKMTAFRYNEAGDFSTQADVDKMVRVCSILTAAGVNCYGYTASTHLDLSMLIACSQVNVSNDYGDWRFDGANRFKMVAKASGDHAVCAGDCRQCRICTDTDFGGHIIEVIKH